MDDPSASSVIYVWLDEPEKELGQNPHKPNEKKN